MRPGGKGASGKPDRAATPSEPSPAVSGKAGIPSAAIVEVLSLGYAPAETGCSQDRWREVFGSFCPKARYHAANLAAHNWDVLLVGGRAFLSSYYGFGGHWLAPDMTLTDATDKELASLYAKDGDLPKRRLFAVGSADVLTTPQNQNKTGGGA